MEDAIITDVQYEPLTEAAFCVLLSLAKAPRHGYAIMKDIESVSDGRIVLSTGTLYGVLKRLLDGGWIERHDAPVTDNRSQKSYALTDSGRHLLSVEMNRLERLLTAARMRTQKESI